MGDLTAAGKKFMNKHERWAVKLKSRYGNMAD